MTKQQFDNYKFSAKTEIKYRDKWEKVYEVDFEKKIINMTSLIYIEDIRN